MSEAVITYLRQKGTPATAAELAKSALHITSAPPKAVVKVIQVLLKDDDRVQKVGEDGWVYVQQQPGGQSLSQQAFLLCKMLPQQVASWREWRQVGFRAFRDGQLKQARLFELNSPGKWSQFAAYLQKIQSQHQQAIFIFDGFGNQMSMLRRAMYELAGSELDAACLTLRQIVKCLHDCRLQSESALSQRLGVVDLDECGMEQLIHTFSAQFLSCLDQLADKDILTVSQLNEFLSDERETIDFSRYGFDIEFLRALPRSPGVYVMIDGGGKILYVGKSKNLNQRLNGYFSSTTEPDEKLTAMRRDMYDVRIYPAGSELEALLLEQELIRMLNPPLNRQTEIFVRLHRQKSRFKRILILPAAEEDTVVAYLLHPERGLKRLCLCLNDRASKAALYPGLADLLANEPLPEVYDQHREEEILQIIEQFYFSDAPVPETIEDPHLSEIAFSWISEHEDSVNCIDLRKVTLPKECLRLLFEYAHHI
ncbi:nucleotide excision repair endonuclease, partial [candidate division KSB1 bacterium]|nr:nucleotide excision repair endonuclease [candidate division KSB1 bacterium]